MIIDRKIEIKVNKKNIDHFKIKGYDVKLKDVINIKTEDLNHGSHKKIKVKCDVCGNEKEIMFQKYIKNVNNGDFYACCSKCAQKKVKKTNNDRFGSDYYTKTNKYRNDIRQTNLEKYGVVEHHLQSNEIKEKIKETNLKKYGVVNPFESNEIKEKIKETNLKKYGTDNPSKNKSVKDIISRKAKERWNKKNIEDEKVINYDNGFYIIMCDKGHTYKICRKLLANRKIIGTDLCTICNPPNSSKSGYENIIYDFIKDNVDNEIIRNERKLLDNKYELDIYIPELKLAFEFNGLYWHNELNKPNKYHLEKTELCEEKSIQLIHIYEDDWVYKSDIVKSMILNKLRKTPNKIYARKCEIREILDNKLVREFLEHNHIQGFIGSKVKIGLFHENELVSLMTFGKRRVSMGKKSSQEGEYELLRFCSRLDTNVVGGANKLFKYFKENYKPKFITTYADRSWSTGGLYYNLGLKFKGKTDPNYYYIIDGLRYHRFGFRKDVLVKEGYDSNKTEHEIMLDRGIYRIYDSGNLKFELNF
jgi:hypothetical protein